MQEAKKRGLTVRWCTLALRNVGLAVPGSVLCRSVPSVILGQHSLVPLVMQFMLGQAGRKRVFVLCARDGFSFPDGVCCLDANC